MVKKRCTWAEKDVFHKYHDEGWCVPVHDDTILFEFLVLEGAQAGLSWETILKRKDSYHAAFDHYNLSKIISYSDKKIESLLQNPGIIRNKLKVHSVIKNAIHFREIQKEFDSFDNYLWNYVGGKPIINSWKSIAEIPVSTDLSDTISKDLKKRGFSFVGSTIIYAFLQAVGVVNDHTVNCFCYKRMK